MTGDSQPGIQLSSLTGRRDHRAQSGRIVDRRRAHVWRLVDPARSALYRRRRGVSVNGSAEGRLRLTILGAFLGSGKTTWLRHQLHAGAFFDAARHRQRGRRDAGRRCAARPRVAARASWSAAAACCHRSVTSSSRELRRICDDRSRIPAGDPRLAEVRPPDQWASRSPRPSSPRSAPIPCWSTTSWLPTSWSPSTRCMGSRPLQVRSAPALRAADRGSRAAGADQGRCRGSGWPCPFGGDARTAKSRSAAHGVGSWQRGRHAAAAAREIRGTAQLFRRAGATTHLPGPHRARRGCRLDRLQGLAFGAAACPRRRGHPR